MISRDVRYKADRYELVAVTATIEPEPTPAEREAILAALHRPGDTSPAEWAEAALREGVEDEPDP